ncbi:MAG: glutamine amidotransferase subunit PdxT [Desulfobacteraceae bacterium 4484_190.3]|nr:MAG: glutamine amidotransferase subunit PdxT [Desulfobacteraceae bacterium 4484_190.3]
MIVGVLALQGAFREHIAMLRQYNVNAKEIRLPSQLQDTDGLIIPGGESTTISKLIEEYCFTDRIKEYSLSGKPIFGTCAGSILLADKIEGRKQDFLNLIDIDIRRNAYGRQVASREIELDVDFLRPDPFRAIFIRAPIIESMGPDVIPFAWYNNSVVLARQDNILVSTFHPELTRDERIHGYFLNMVRYKV